jgi:flagellin-like protein
VFFNQFSLNHCSKSLRRRKKKKEEKKMNFRQLRKNVKAISPIISVLLMIAVAVVAALVTYAWVMGFIGFQTGKTGKSIQIQSVTYASGTVTVYAQNVGDSTVQFTTGQGLYVDGALATGVTITGGVDANLNLAQGKTAIITGTPITAPATGANVVVKVTSNDGTFNSVQQVLVP